MVWDSDGTEPIDGGHKLGSVCARQDTKHVSKLIRNTLALESELSDLLKRELGGLLTHSEGEKLSAKSTKLNNCVNE